MKTCLDTIVIDAPVKPILEWKLNQRNWERYDIHASIEGVAVARINITRALNLADRPNDSFFFDLSGSTLLPKPFVSWQETEKAFRGRGICGRVIILANEFYRGKLGTDLYSDTHFITSSRNASKRVWEKLQQQGIAKYEPHINVYGEPQDRWFISQ
jgi:hypothetical protein